VSTTVPRCSLGRAGPSELIELCELVQPTPEEAAARRSAVAAVTEVVRSIWPAARCEVFGSYATGLYVPTSDIDLVILDSGCSNIQAGLKALATSRGKRVVAQSIQVGRGSGKGGRGKGQ
jgi:non-canonical poly(A) RNA polymerase PAPD5/7